MAPWRITHVEETESTNLLARSGRPGDVFTAGFQTAGRGRLDHRWLAERGQNLMMSAVIDVSGLEAEHAATSASGICGGIQPDGRLLVGGASVWAGEAHVAEF